MKPILKISLQKLKMKVTLTYRQMKARAAKMMSYLPNFH